MDNYNDFKEAVQKRASTNDEWYDEVEKYCEEMAVAFSADIDRTVRFLDEECTAEEFVWLSEVYDRIAARTKSVSFIDALTRLAAKYPEETKEYNILSFIDDAKDMTEYTYMDKNRFPH